MQLNTLLKKLDLWLTYVVVGLIPLIVSPFFSSTIDTTKVVVLSFGVVIILLIKAIKLVSVGSFGMRTSKLDFPVLLVALAYLLSGIVRTPNKMEAFAIPGVATAVIGASLLFFIVNQLEKSEKKVVQTILIVSFTILSLVSLLSASNLLTGLTFVPDFLENQQFNLTGSISSLVIIIAALIPSVLAKIISEGAFAKKLFYVVALGILALTLVVNATKFLPNNETRPRLPSFQTSWEVAIDSLKVSPVLGIGPGNYLTAFSRFRPVTYNQTDLWPARFSFSHSHYLTALSEAGLLAGAGLILILYALYTNLRSDLKAFSFKKEEYLASLSPILAFALFLILPSNLTSLVVALVLLAITSETRSISTKLFQSQEEASVLSRVPAFLVALPVLVLAGIFFYRASGILAAEYTFRQALNSLAQNQAQETYDLMRASIAKNPGVDRYRSSFAQVNFTLANALATKENLTDQDRANITQLIRQSISEARAAVVLNPTRSGNWELLARIYRNIMPLAQGADNFATQSYSQAIALDPVNPNTRIALGGLYYTLKDYPNAIESFRLATLTKPDLANAHYNLALAYREDNQIEKAITEMQAVIALVAKDSSDYETAQKELANLESRRPQTGTAGTSPNLEAPQAPETPALEPPIQLEDESAPPQGPEVTPTPAPAI